MWDHDELTAATARRYGPQSQAVVFVLYEELVKVRALLAENPGLTALKSRVATLRRQIQDLYDEGGYLRTGPAPHARVVASSPLVLEYDQGVFEARYRSAAAAVARDLYDVSDGRLRSLRTGTCYMYVIDDHGRLLVWNHPFRFTDLVFGRNRATIGGVPVAHPMLVAERLRVRAAGEVVLFAAQGAPPGRIGAAIVNTKSGHFRPPPSCAAVIREAFGATNVTWQNLDVFTMDPDAAPSDPQAVR